MLSGSVFANSTDAVSPDEINKLQEVVHTSGDLIDQAIDQYAQSKGFLYGKNPNSNKSFYRQCVNLV